MFALLLISTLSYSELEPIQIPEGLSNADACSICKNVITGITDIMDNAKVQTAIAQLAIELCQKFSSTFAQNLCKKIVSDYLPDVISFIVSGISKASICDKIGLCKSNNDEIEYIEIPEGLENGIGCSICKHLASTVAQILTETQVESKVLEQAQKLCAKLPKIGRDFCNSLVSKYIPKLVDYLISGLSTSEVCVKLNICSSNDDENDDAYLELYLEMDDDDYVTEIELPIGLSNADNCAICKKAVGFVSAAMGNSIVQAVVKAAATAACGLISGGVGAALCKTIVKVSVGPIMSWLSQKLSQSKICSKLGYCKGNDIELDFDIEEEDDDEIIVIPIPEGLDNGVACDVCKTVVGGIVTILKDTSITSQVAAQAAKLCNKVPAAGQGICSSIVNKYLPNVISWLADGLSKLNVCGKLSLC
ncbi:surfactant B protein [Histomonas meleagridis]|uniref:surfactant B protein n=1 Tax=Histomonas meleagridis TaxID=135588 RepID=UPI003559BCDF|nr:surfactant B protein [Histomonas meleagridis]KAH0797505.1 surfactant B protein [Histomonas meleagridis]